MCSTTAGRSPPTSDRVSAQRPDSDVSPGVGLVGLATVWLWVEVCRHWGAIADLFAFPGPRAALDGPVAALLGLVWAGGAMAGWLLLIDKVHMRPSTGLDWAAPRSWAEARATALPKLVGLWAAWGLIALVYAVGRWYWQPPWLFAMHVLEVALLPLLGLSAAYVLWLERYAREPQDGAWHLGQWLMGEGGDRAEILAFLRCWAVKGFFIAFMLSVVPGGFAAVVDFDWRQVGDPAACCRWLIDWLFMLDVQIGTLGYLLTLRPLDAHIRSANPLVAGWVAALVCYPPFVLMGAGGPLDYTQGAGDWASWLGAWRPLLWVWGAWLVALTGLYAAATVAFGVRFSNLTYRGVITHGPYALTRHPAYLAKNLFWWSATLPFLPASGSLLDALRNTALLGLVSGIYWWRARTEERHLYAEDAKYRDYWHWAAESAPITRAIGALLRV